MIARGTPKIIIFDNGSLPAVGTAAPTSIVAYRHAAKAPGVNFYIQVGLRQTPIPAAGVFAFQKGMGQVVTLTAGDQWVIWATFDEKTKIIAGPKVVPIEENRRYEQYLIGSKLKNYRIMTFSRPHFFE